MFGIRTWLGVVLLAATIQTSHLAAQQTAPAGQGALRPELIKRFDKDGDGKISREERAAAREELRQGGRMGQKLVQTVLPEGVRVVRDVEYARVGDKHLLLDIYLPKSEGEPLPVVIWVHGGAWQAGSKDPCRAVFLSGEGYAVVSINYRLTDVALFPAQIHDCKAAVRWVRAHAKEYGFDPARVGVWGSSAGGHLVALLGTSGGIRELEGDIGGNLDQSSRVQAVCDFCGPSTFRAEDSEQDPDKPREAGPQVAQKLLGGPLNKNREKARLASPVEHVSKDDPPFLIVHGEKDNVVPVKHSRLLADALRRAGVDVTLKVVPDAGHGVGGLVDRKMVAEFFDQHLKRGPVSQPVGSSVE
ncbi:MAG: alpha/beta hydrolase fold domain-containing protein [Phycisphaerae bacterium]